MKEWPENKVSDGKWHHLDVDFFDKVSYSGFLSNHLIFLFAHF